MPIREPNQFQIQLAVTVPPIKCVKCTENISALDDPEHVILWPAGMAGAWHVHIVCFGAITAGMVEFFQTFVKEDGKTRILQ